MSAGIADLMASTFGVQTERSPLSDLEAEVLERLADWRSAKQIERLSIRQIAAHLSFSPGKTYAILRSACDKLGASTPTRAVTAALSRDWIAPVN